ncbi:hypothetical protein HFP71_37580 [Streptomyces sp. ARC32]|uniref:hypothetical protein n=1 Tax=Streptomyces sp. KO7888 TaxID=2602737 RepID=UPI0013F5DF47|nr:hypothetical protein [Streptomyces sp. KO7888]NHI11861.1 hypothetical protein [Streptomyces sp. KO7888]
MGQRYHADPERIEALTRTLEEISTLSRDMTEEFLDDVSRTCHWPGTIGEFAEKAVPKEQKERQAAKDTMISIRDALVSITDATMGQVQLMKNTRDHNIEEIEKGNNRINTNGLDGNGGSGRRGGR